MRGFVVAMIALGISVAACADRGVTCRSMKAPTTVNLAEAACQDFSDADEHLDATELAHLRNTHQRVGAFTIGQLMGEAHRREDAREAALALQMRHEQQARDAEVEVGEKKDVAAVISLFGSTSLIHGYSVHDNRFSVFVDQDVWETMSSQDHDLFRDSLLKAWSYSYNNRRHVTKQQVEITIYNLANSQLDWNETLPNG